MSFRLTDWALDVEGITPTQKLVLVVLAHHCNGQTANAKCWPSMAQLEQTTGLTARAIQKALAALESRNLIDRRLGRGRKTTVYYLACQDSPNQRLDLEGVSAAADIPSRASSRGERGSGPGANEIHRSGDSGVNDVHLRGERGSRRGERRSPGTGKEQGREQGDSERDARSCTTGARAAAAGSTLSEPPGPRWREIAARVRPDLPDPEAVRRKFEVHHRGHTFGDQAEEERAWELWLLREHKNRQTRYTEPQKGDREPGSFLATIPARRNDLTAEYEVLHDES
jgi:hypothetical protein